MSRRHRRLLVTAILLLSAGVVNYYLVQPHIMLFGPAYRQPYLSLSRIGFVSKLLTGYFADVLWCWALVLVTVILSERKLLHLSGRILILVIPFASEFAQAAGIINGVFDWFDIVAYSVTELVSVFLFPGLFRLYEK